MGNVQERVAITTDKQQWDQDLVYNVLNDPCRRRILLALAQKGPQPAAAFSPGRGRMGTDVILKHLVLLRNVGLVMKQPNPGDGRCSLYALSPTVPIVRTAEGCVIDFGFCMVRFE